MWQKCTIVSGFVAAVEVNTSCEIVRVRGHADHPWYKLFDTLPKLAARSGLIHFSLDSSRANSRWKQVLCLFLHCDYARVRTSCPIVEDEKLMGNRR